MSNKEIIESMKKQLDQQQAQMVLQSQQNQQQMEVLLETLKQMNANSGNAAGSTGTRSENSVSAARPSLYSVPSFTAFDSTAELWTDYYSRFLTSIKAHSVPETKIAQIFLTNQTVSVYKLLQSLASQQQPPININESDMETLAQFMAEQYNPKLFVIRERYKFWSDLSRKHNESVTELAARIRQDAVTCDFGSITDSQDDAMCTRFICSVNNEAILKAIFKEKGDELTFAKAINIALEIEEANKVAKETVSFSTPSTNEHTYSVKVHTPSRAYRQVRKRPSGDVCNDTRSSLNRSNGPPCGRCGRKGHTGTTCHFKNTVCNYCNKLGHIERACYKKKKDSTVHTVKPNNSDTLQTVKMVRSAPQLQQSISLDGHQTIFEIDTGAGDSFLSKSRWIKIGRPALQTTDKVYTSASGHKLPVLGVYKAKSVAVMHNNESSLDGKQIDFVVTDIPQLNLLGRDAIATLSISLDDMIHGKQSSLFICKSVYQCAESLQSACKQMCNDFPDVFNDELGCLKDFELDIKFKPDVTPVFCKPRPVPFAIQDHLAQAYERGIAKGVWKPVQFNDFGTPVVPIKKPLRPGQTVPSLRVCGDYSATINHQLEIHRQPIPVPEELMQKLGGGYCFTKIDLADAYNQIPLSPESQKRMALSTHKGVLLQMRLPFGITSAPGYFQEIMTQLTSDLKGVAVYLDDILVSGKNAEDHLENLRQLLQKLQDHGLHCRLDKCEFAKPTVEYLGHTLSSQGISKGKKVDAVRKMPRPHNLSTLKSFLGSVQFYGKFLPNLSTITEPLHKLTRNGVEWKWKEKEEEAFQTVKDMLCTDMVLAHFDSSLPIGISCDASNVGIGAVLFHRFQDGQERPIANASKTLTESQRKYSQIQKEALAIVFALRKFHQYLYGRKFILVTDHKPLLSVFSPTKATPALAANRLARWALILNQYNYSIEYRNTSAHGNADVLSRLPSGPDAHLDHEEEEEDNMYVINAIKTISSQLKPTDPGVLLKESAKDPTISTVIRYTQEGWPQKKASTEKAEEFRKVADFLSVEHGCLLYGTRVVIPQSLRKQVIDILHTSHFGIEKMKHLARTAVYWPGLDFDIKEQCRKCTSCGEHQNKPPKMKNHPWMLPEKPWSRIHVDHAVNFMGNNWLVIVDAYSKYPCIYPTTTVSSKSTMALLEETFAHFGYPHSLVTDNASSFTSGEFQEWCKQRGIVHLTGAPYHPATNGAAKRLVQTFKQALKKSNLPCKSALQEFLMQYWRTPLAGGYSPSKLLTGRQI